MAKGVSGGSILKGLKDSRTKPPSKGATSMGASVDSGATRKGTAPTPKTLGPRTA